MTTRLHRAVAAQCAAEAPTAAGPAAASAADARAAQQPERRELGRRAAEPEHLADPRLELGERPPLAARGGSRSSSFDRAVGSFDRMVDSFDRAVESFDRVVESVSFDRAASRWLAAGCLERRVETGERTVQADARHHPI